MSASGATGQGQDELTFEKLVELRALDAAATPGPWRVEPDEDDESVTTIASDSLYIARLEWPDVPTTPEADAFNAALIVAMRNALPALLASAGQPSRSGSPL